MNITEQRDALWQLLDDIDTLDDAAREHDDVFRVQARQIQKRRWEIHNPEDHSERRIPGEIGEVALAAGKITENVRLPDGSGFFVASFPLPKTHWLYTEGRSEPPMPMRTGLGAKRNELADQIRDAARHAIRASTMNGKEKDFDPDAMVQNMVVGLLGYWTEDGRRGV